MAYKTLEAAKRYLKNLGSLQADPTKGVTQDDLNAGQDFADNQINAALIPMWTVAQLATAPLIANIADLLGSHFVIQIIYERYAVEDEDETSTPQRLLDRGISLIKQLRGEEYPRLYLVDSSGEMIAKRLGVLLPKWSAPDTVFFPDDDTTKSHDETTRQNLETIFKEGNIQAPKLI